MIHGGDNDGILHLRPISLHHVAEQYFFRNSAAAVQHGPAFAAEAFKVGDEGLHCGIDGGVFQKAFQNIG